MSWPEPVATKKLKLAEGVEVGEGEALDVAVRSGVGVGVATGIGVGVALGVAVGTTVGVEVGLGVGLEVTVGAGAADTVETPATCPVVLALLTTPSLLKVFAFFTASAAHVNCSSAIAGCFK